MAETKVATEPDSRNHAGSHGSEGIPQGSGGEKEKSTREAAARQAYLRRVVALLALRKRTLAGIVLASLVLSLFGLITPHFTQIILDEVVPAGDLARLARIVLVLAIVTTYQITLTVYRRLALLRLTLVLARTMLREFCSHLLSLPAHFFKVNRSGDLVARFTDESYARHLFTTSLTRAAIDSLMVVVYFVVMFQYSTLLTLLVLAFLVVFGVFTVATGPILKRSHKRVLEERAAQEGQLREIITSIDLVKSMALEAVVQGRWEGIYKRFLETDYRTKMLRQILESVSTAVKFLSTVALLWAGAVLVVEGQLTTGELVAFSMYASQAMLPLLSFITLSEEVQQARAALERIGEVLGQQPEPRCPAVASEGIKLQGRVTFDQVFFHYEGQPSPLLRGISFDVKPGERVAIVGRSGSGKTTVGRLVLGLYRPTRGRILVDGQDLAQLDLAAYRRQVGVVLQENLLLAGTIEENIALGDDRADGIRVVNAARLAGADEFIARMADSYQSVVGDLGLTLSGGQRQRINLARALYRQPRLLILDEPTSSLDYQSEQSIQGNLEAALNGRTALIITHSPQVLHHVDRVLVLEDGAIAAQGTPQKVAYGQNEPFRKVSPCKPPKEF